jgi:hypothetical protein
MLAQRRRSRSANRAQQVVLACAVFDKDGRIMVTPEGLLPNRKVTTSNMERVRIPNHKRLLSGNDNRNSP